MANMCWNVGFLICFGDKQAKERFGTSGTLVLSLVLKILYLKFVCHYFQGGETKNDG